MDASRIKVQGVSTASTSSVRRHLVSEVSTSFIFREFFYLLTSTFWKVVNYFTRQHGMNSRTLNFTERCENPRISLHPTCIASRSIPVLPNYICVSTERCIACKWILFIKVMRESIPPDYSLHTCIIWVPMNKKKQIVYSSGKVLM
jgi:hypothetical protein